MLVDIIFLTLTLNDDLYNLTKNAISSLVKSEKEIKFNIIVIESNKDFNNLGYFYDCNKLIIPEEEFNYNKFCMIGLENSSNEWVALCNNDLLFHPDWFTEILNVYSSDSSILSFCPWNLYQDWHENIMGKNNDEVFFGYRVSHEIAGWCLVFRREILNFVNILSDVKFWFSDNVYANELIRNNIKHCLVKKSHVDHITSYTSRYIPCNDLCNLTQGQIVNWNRYLNEN